MVRCADNSLYTGVTTNPTKRIDEHNSCNKKGAKYTRARRPVTLAYTEACSDKIAAYKREYQIKQLSKQKKELLVAEKQ